MSRQRREEAGLIYTTYILQNSISLRYYIGSTNDLQRRISEHNRGQTKSTKQNGAWILVYREEYKESLEAKKRERQIKTYKGGEAFKRLIKGAGIVHR